MPGGRTTRPLGLPAVLPRSSSSGGSWGACGGHGSPERRSWGQLGAAAAPGSAGTGPAGRARSRCWGSRRSSASAAASCSAPAAGSCWGQGRAGGQRWQPHSPAASGQPGGDGHAGIFQGQSSARVRVAVGVRRGRKAGWLQCPRGRDREEPAGLRLIPGRWGLLGWVLSNPVLPRLPQSFDLSPVCPVRPQLGHPVPTAGQLHSHLCLCSSHLPKGARGALWGLWHLPEPPVLALGSLWPLQAGGGTMSSCARAAGGSGWTLCCCGLIQTPLAVLFPQGWAPTSSGCPWGRRCQPRANALRGL